MAQARGSDADSGPIKVGRAEAARWSGALDLLRLVRARPGVTRAEAARVLGVGSGTATEICSRLRALDLLSEHPAPPSGRGRPTTTLHAHPDGPLVAVVDIRQAEWRVAVADLEGALSEPATGRHGSKRPEQVLAAVGEAVAAIGERHGTRVRAVAVSAAATVRRERFVQSSVLGWRDVEVAPLLPGVPQVLGNDATLAGLAEARLAHPGRSVLYLTIEVGIGGVYVDGDRAVTGATGAGGEFGHVPFGEPGLACPCGATGCWDVAVDGRAVARRLGEPEPDDPRAYLIEALVDPRARAAVAACSTSLGRGAAGLANVLDPEVVCFGGLAPEVRRAAPDAFAAAFEAGLMGFRRDDPPELIASALGPDAFLLGAAEAAFDAVLTEQSIGDWTAARFA
ncbi:ROK family transcriptional regulator [Glycomyces scopariae]|uniref:Sugar kinase of the NBD/HSP70 family, may contain an N-terminal HTH domain n=1 Tax=Glycomyces sambucus TaxID=380244 RepID=A0A1G9MIA5_9ACTN|nr:ROK family protein [Glycomyces sambucus]SDL74012.1 Sugar kinase of the NBD/HSP70 family, may contain an N-terminal HTH domain [Glycomyces sambucus]